MVGSSDSAGRPGPAGRVGLSDLGSRARSALVLARWRAREVVLLSFEFVWNLGFRIWDLRASRGTSGPDVRARSQDKNRESSTD